MGHLDPQGEIIPKEFPNPEQPRIWGGGGGWEQTGMVLPTVTLAASASLQLLTSLFYTVDAIVTVWFTVQNKPKILKNYWEFFKPSSKVELVIYIVSLINLNQHKFYRW